MQRSQRLDPFSSCHFSRVRRWTASSFGACLMGSVVLASCAADPGPLFEETEGGRTGSQTRSAGAGTRGASSNASPTSLGSAGEESQTPEGATTQVEEDPTNNVSAIEANGAGTNREEGSADIASEEGQSATQSEPSVVAPFVVSVLPENGTVGVAADTIIEITFNVSMNRALTQSAYQSEGVPSSSVEFSWNDASTRLTITPREPLEYSSGSELDLIEARRVNLFLSSSAEDTEGNRLAEPAESSFALLREVRGQVFAVSDRDLSGNYRSNDTYGGGQCSRDEVTICFGDSGTGNEIAYRGFVTFDLSSVPSDLEGLATARLSFDIADLEGQPFTLGGLQVEHAEFDEIGLDAFNGEALASIGVIDRSGEPGDTLGIDVLDALDSDLSLRSRAQFRLSFEVFNDEQEDFDAVVTSVDSHSLDYTFLVP